MRCSVQICMYMHNWAQFPYRIPHDELQYEITIGIGKVKRKFCEFGLMREEGFRIDLRETVVPLDTAMGLRGHWNPGNFLINWRESDPSWSTLLRGLGRYLRGALVHDIGVIDGRTSVGWEVLNGDKTQIHGHRDMMWYTSLCNSLAGYRRPDPSTLGRYGQAVQYVSYGHGGVPVKTPATGRLGF
jgi:hypothetical protein